MLGHCGRTSSLRRSLVAKVYFRVADLEDGKQIEIRTVCDPPVSDWNADDLSPAQYLAALIYNGLMEQSVDTKQRAEIKMTGVMVPKVKTPQEPN